MRADYVSIIFIGRYGLKSTIVDGLTVPVNAIPCDTIMENIIVSFHIYIRVCEYGTKRRIVINFARSRNEISDFQVSIN